MHRARIELLHVTFDAGRQRAEIFIEFVCVAPCRTEREDNRRESAAALLQGLAALQSANLPVR